ncbi:hypothetical protein LXM94_17670, partial [Rhizobium sp. TRM95111]|uniref:hypothetical protein n=1 Tax=Rhizobium alarense TaxID=2846851 RepID=UPI001F1F3398
MIGKPETLTPATAFRVAYELPASAVAPLPLYLVADFPEATRFRGMGFLPLTAGARGPFGLGHAEGRTRAIVPLHTSRSLQGGIITAFLLAAGQQDVGVSLVTGGECGEQVLRSQRSPILKVELGVPEIVVQDTFAAGDPIRTVTDSRGHRELRVYDDRYEVYERATGALLLARSGREPCFSPGGRFLGAIRHTDNRIEVIDLALGSVVQEFRPGVLAWARNDSFMVHGATRRQLENTVVSSLNPDVVSVNSMSNAGAGWLDVEVVLDIDRMFVAHTDESIANHEGGARLWDMLSGASMEFSEIPPEGAVGDPAYSVPPKRQRFSLRQLVRQQHGVNIPMDGVLWRLGEPVAVSHVDELFRYDLKWNEPQGYVMLADKATPAAGTLSGPGTGDCALEDARRGLARTKLPVLCAAAVVGRGLGRLPATVEPVGEETVFERIASVVGALDPAISIVHRSYGSAWDAGPQRKRRIDDLVAAASSITPAFSAGIKPLPQEMRMVTCHTAPEELDPAYIEQSWQWREEGRDMLLLFVNCYAGSSRISFASLLLVTADGVRAIDRQLVADGASEDTSPFGWSEADDSEIRVFPVGSDRILVSASYSGYAALIDPGSGERVGKLFPLADATLIRAMRLTADGRHLVQLNRNGRFAIFRADSGEQRLAGAHVDDEIVVMLPDGRFDTTYEGAHALNIRFAGLSALQTVHQFAAALHRPGLAHAVMEGDAVADRPGTLGTPPLVFFTVSASEGGRRSIVVDATDEEALASLRLFVDGRLVDERAVSGADAKVVFDIKDPGGGRWVTAVAVDDGGLVSTPKAILLPPPVAIRGSLRAVIVGIDAYRRDPAIPPLAFAQSDAERLKTSLTSTDG